MMSGFIARLGMAGLLPARLAQWLLRKLAERHA